MKGSRFQFMSLCRLIMVKKLLCLVNPPGWIVPIKLGKIQFCWTWLLVPFLVILIKIPSIPPPFLEILLVRPILILPILPSSVFIILTSVSVGLRNLIFLKVLVFSSWWHFFIIFLHNIFAFHMFLHSF
jgi:hypothetical protein